MDKQEAFEIAEKELESYRLFDYADLVSKIGNPEGFERFSKRGEAYQVEFECFFDDRENKNLRVAAAISYSGWTDFFPVSNDFIMAPDGSFCWRVKLYERSSNCIGRAYGCRKGAEGDVEEHATG